MSIGIFSLKLNHDVFQFLDKLSAFFSVSLYFLSFFKATTINSLVLFPMVIKSYHKIIPTLSCCLFSLKWKEPCACLGNFSYIKIYEGDPSNCGAPIGSTIIHILKVLIEVVALCGPLEITLFHDFKDKSPQLNYFPSRKGF